MSGDDSRDDGPRTFDDRLAPGFLIAPPTQGDPNFDRTVVLLAVHQEDGSMGFVVNRPADISLHRLLKELSIAPHVDDRQVMIGGPVSGFSGFVLYTHAYGRPLAPGIVVAPTLSISPSRDLLELAAHGELEGNFELMLGYAGWAPGQLDAELARGSWLHTGFDSELLFDVPIGDRWDEIFHRIGVSPAGFMNVPGGAQA